MIPPNEDTNVDRDDGMVTLTDKDGEPFTRSEHVVCILRDYGVNPRTAWCGRWVAMEFRFLSIDHAAFNGEQGGRLQACPDCATAAAAALAKGTATP
jgi:hypothetical protein